VSVYLSVSLALSRSLSLSRSRSRSLSRALSHSLARSLTLSRPISCTTHELYDQPASTEIRYTAPRCTTLQQTTTHSQPRRGEQYDKPASPARPMCVVTYCNAMHRNAPRRTTLHHTATHCNTRTTSRRRTIRSTRFTGNADPTSKSLMKKQTNKRNRALSEIVEFTIRCHPLTMHTHTHTHTHTDTHTHTHTYTHVQPHAHTLTLPTNT